MDSADYWAIADADIDIQNPMTDRKHRLLDDYCDIRDGLKVLDIGCGKAWMLRQWADRFAIDATGVDSNPAFLAAARQKRPARGMLRLVEGDAARFSAAAESYDIVMCLGAVEALGGFVSAIDWMTAAAKPGGAIVVGDLTLKRRPVVQTHEHLPPDPVELAQVIQRHGAEVSALISASDADYERYASHHRHATLRWVREHADHRDRDDVLDRCNAQWRTYLGTIRPRYGWTIFVANKTA